MVCQLRELRTFKIRRKILISQSVEEHSLPASQCYAMLLPDVRPAAHVTGKQHMISANSNENKRDILIKHHLVFGFALEVAPFIICSCLVTSLVSNAVNNHLQSTNQTNDRIPLLRATPCQDLLISFSLLLQLDVHAPFPTLRTYS